MPASPMQLALLCADTAANAGEVPVGAVIVGPDGEILAVAHNLSEMGCDPTAHAEMLAIRMACDKRNSSRLEGCDMYVTLEPCPMCAAAISFARIRRLYYGAYDPKGGGVEHGPRVYSHATCHHRPEVYGGMQESECGEKLKSFFQARRA